jgi:hypothetical protein
MAMLFKGQELDIVESTKKLILKFMFAAKFVCNEEVFSIHCEIEFAKF